MLKDTLNAKTIQELQSIVFNLYIKQAISDEEKTALILMPFIQLKSYLLQYALAEQLTASTAKPTTRTRKTTKAKADVK